jgi:hypothetical protein
MPAKPSKPSPPPSAITERLLDLEIQIAPVVAKISELKGDLRFLSHEIGQGFVEEVAGKGAVEVKPSGSASSKGRSRC